MADSVVIFNPAIDPIALDMRPSRSGIELIGVGGRTEMRAHLDQVKIGIAKALELRGYSNRTFQITRAADHSWRLPHYVIERIL